MDQIIGYHSRCIFGTLNLVMCYNFVSAYGFLGEITVVDHMEMMLFIKQISMLMVVCTSVIEQLRF
jgi:hypothetical protein